MATINECSVVWGSSSTHRKSPVQGLPVRSVAVFTHLFASLCSCCGTGISRGSGSGHDCVSILVELYFLFSEKSQDVLVAPQAHVQTTELWCFSFYPLCESYVKPRIDLSRGNLCWHRRPSVPPLWVVRSTQIRLSDPFSGCPRSLLVNSLGTLSRPCKRRPLLYTLSTRNAAGVNLVGLFFFARSCCNSSPILYLPFYPLHCCFTSFIWF